jgi:simple sugar transport system permease protein
VTAGALDAALGRVLGGLGPLRPLVLALGGVGVALAFSALLVLGSGKNPLVAYGSLAQGALGSPDRVAVALNKATPYVLTAVGIALCLRARVVNIGGEGQIAVGGLAATGAALALPGAPPVVLPLVAMAAGAAGGAVWAGIAALIRLKRNVHEVLVTLLMNFVGVLLVGEMLQGDLGEPGAGFPQSPMLAPAAWLPRLVPRTDLHAGILVALAAVGLTHVLLWRTPFGFRLRLRGASETAAAYAGVSTPRIVLAVMVLAGALAGLAGAIDVLGVHYRLIEGFSSGFGFTAVSIALIGGMNPVGILAAGLFFAFLETGALAMQRAVGVPSPLVAVIQGLTMVFVLTAVARNTPRRRGGARTHRG